MEDDEPARQPDQGANATEDNHAGHTQATAEATEDGANYETEAATEAPSKKVTLCTVCEKVEAKYKCPRCYVPYCSVACNKIHRENHPPDPEPAPQPAAVIDDNKPSEPQASTIQISEHSLRGQKFNDPFRTLQHSEELQWLFRKYPRLPEQLLEIHAATEGPATLQSRIPASLLKDLPNQNKDWDRDKAMARGKEALRQARKAEGEDGEAVREYSELVLHLMEEQESKRGR